MISIIWQVVLASKDERGALGRTVQPGKSLGHGAVSCLIWGMVSSRIQETGWVWNGSSFLSMQVFFLLSRAKFDSSEMTYINPRLTKLFFVTRLTKRGLLQPPP